MQIDNTPLLNATHIILAHHQELVNIIESQMNSQVVLDYEAQQVIFLAAIKCINTQADMIRKLVEEQINISEGVEKLLNNINKD